MINEGVIEDELAPVESESRRESVRIRENAQPQIQRLDDIRVDPALELRLSAQNTLDVERSLHAAIGRLENTA